MTSVTVIPDGHYYRLADGQILSNGVYSYKFFKRYLDSFDTVKVIARISEIDKASSNLKIASGTGIEFLSLPQYKGPLEYLKHYFAIKNKLREYLSSSECVILRAPSTVFSLAVDILSGLQVPWGMEVVVDPWEYFAPGTIDSILRPIYRYKWTTDLKNACKKCDCVSYVTEFYLQSKYPCKANLFSNCDYFTNHYSSVEIADDSVSLPKKYGDVVLNKMHLVHVAANLEGYGKGHITALNILKGLLEQGFNVEITFIGDGSKLKEFIAYSKKIGVAEHARFLGRLPGVEAVRRELRKSDLFIFPTKAEGLPRVLIEAMAEGLPCLSTPVCGIPEILDSDWMFNYNDIDGFINKIIECINNPILLEEQSLRNVNTALRFEHSKLQIERKRFYDFLKADHNVEKY